MDRSILLLISANFLSSDSFKIHVLFPKFCSQNQSFCFKMYAGAIDISNVPTSYVGFNILMIDHGCMSTTLLIMYESMTRYKWTVRRSHHFWWSVTQKTYRNLSLNLSIYLLLQTKTVRKSGNSDNNLSDIRVI